MERHAILFAQPHSKPATVALVQNTKSVRVLESSNETNGEITDVSVGHLQKTVSFKKPKAPKHYHFDQKCSLSDMPLKHMQKSSEEMRNDMMRHQREQNRLIADKLSPVAKYKDYLRRSRVKGIQRRKFSILMGIPKDKQEARRQASSDRFRFRNVVRLAAEELDCERVYYAHPSVANMQFTTTNNQIIRPSPIYDATEIELD